MSKEPDKEARQSEQISIRGRDLTRIEAMAKEGCRSRQDQIGLILDEFCAAHGLHGVTGKKLDEAATASEPPGGADQRKDQP